MCDQFKKYFKFKDEVCGIGSLEMDFTLNVQQFLSLRKLSHLKIDLLGSGILSAQNHMAAEDFSIFALNIVTALFRMEFLNAVKPAS